VTLWDKGGAVDPRVLEFTVGDDYLLDGELLPYDCLASAAHVKTLEGAGILAPFESAALVQALRQIRAEGLEITKENEDVHTALESRLTELLGDLGKKIHTGRSRNDQVMAALQLWCRDRLQGVHGGALSLCRALNAFARENDRPMAGYTHTQRAMPSSVPLLFASYIESLLDDCALLETAWRINNRSPLGSAAGYGTSLGLDRERTARLLGFDGARSCIYVQARPKHTATSIFPLCSVMKSLDRLASDLLLFTTAEFGFFSLPDAFCTGSSIMPQKKNYDVLELVRGRAAHVHSLLTRVDATGAKLVSGYHRDFQLTKGPLMEAFRVTGESLAVMELVVTGLEARGEALRRSLSPELFATDRAYELVREGVPFRDAYREVAASLGELSVPEDGGEGRPHLAFRDYTPEMDARAAALAAPRLPLFE